MSHPQTHLKGRRPRLGPRGDKGRADIKSLPAPRDRYLPLADPTMLAADDAPVVFITKQTDIAKRTTKLADQRRNINHNFSIVHQENKIKDAMRCKLMKITK
jgi:hypothetical protein